MKFNVAETVLYVYMRCLVPAMLCGVHGIGKTSLVLQMARRRRKELGQAFEEIGVTARNMKFQNQKDMFGFWALDVPVTEKDELIGYGMPVDLRKMAFELAVHSGASSPLLKAQELLEDLKKFYNTDREYFMKYIRGDRFLPAEDHTGGGIWMPDELNRDQSGISTPIAQIALNGTFLDYKMPKGIWTATSINPPGEGYSVRELDSSLMDRFAFVPVSSSIDDWTQWAIDNKFHTDVVQFVNERKTEVFNPHDKMDYDPGKDSSSRGIDYLNSLYYFLVTDEAGELEITKDKDALMGIFVGVFGKKSGGLLYSFFTSARDIKALSAEEIVRDYGWESGIEGDRTWAGHYKKSINKVRMQVLRMNATDKDGEQRGDKNKEVRVDLLNQTIGYCVRWMDEAAERNQGTQIRTEDARGMANILLFMHDLSKDLGRSFITSNRVKKNRKFMQAAVAQEDAIQLVNELLVKVDFEVAHLKKEAA